MNDIEYLQRIAMTDRYFVRYEGLPKKSIVKLCKTIKDLKAFNAYSDDTQLSIRTYKAIQHAIEDGGINTDKALLNFKRELKYWICGLPPHLGKATAVSCFKNLLGYKTSGYNSAGNGALMRVGAVARFFTKNDLCDPVASNKIRLLTIENTVSTHRNYEACVTSLWHVILCIAFKKSHFYHTTSTILAELTKLLNLLEQFVLSSEDIFKKYKVVNKRDKSVSDIIGFKETCDALSTGITLEEFSKSNTKFYKNDQISGYCIDTNVFATLKFLQTCVESNELKDFNFLKSCFELVALGGDTDTVAVVYAHLFFNAYPLYTCLCDSALQAMRKNVDFYNELHSGFLNNQGVLFNVYHFLRTIPKNVWLIFKMSAIRIKDTISVLK